MASLLRARDPLLADAYPCMAETLEHLGVKIERARRYKNAKQENIPEIYKDLPRTEDLVDLPDYEENWFNYHIAAQTRDRVAGITNADPDIVEHFVELLRALRLEDEAANSDVQMESAS